MARAAEENKAVHFLSSPSGADLYRAMGFEEVGSGEILGGIEYAFIKSAVCGAGWGLGDRRNGHFPACPHIP
jgi:hypothetical protein